MHQTQNYWSAKAEKAPKINCYCTRKQLWWGTFYPEFFSKESKSIYLFIIFIYSNITTGSRVIEKLFLGREGTHNSSSFPALAWSPDDRLANPLNIYDVSYLVHSLYSKLQLRFIRNVFTKLQLTKVYLNLTLPAKFVIWT